MHTHNHPPSSTKKIRILCCVTWFCVTAYIKVLSSTTHQHYLESSLRQQVWREAQDSAFFTRSPVMIMLDQHHTFKMHCPILPFVTLIPLMITYLIFAVWKAGKTLIKPITYPYHLAQYWIYNKSPNIVWNKTICEKHGDIVWMGWEGVKRETQA